MMGDPPTPQSQFFYAFNLDEKVPRNHLLRQIDGVIDLRPLREHLAPFYSHTGRPSIDPELMFRMLLIGYCYGIRSERRLCEEVELNLAYRWFCRLSIEDTVPEHSTFSKNRHGRFRDSDAFRFMFEQVLERCMAEGLVSGEGFAVDASIVKADANRQRGKDDDDDWSSPGGCSRAVREYLATLDEAPASGKAPKYVSATDPAARWTAAPGSPAFFAYSTNYLIDIEAGIIVDVEATPSHRTAEAESTKKMIEHVEERFNLKPKRLAGDTAYGTGPMLEWLVEEKGIEPHVPVWDKSARRDGSFAISDFTWNEAANEYRCPNQKPLRSTGRITTDSTRLYRTRNNDCRHCPDKYRCCPNTPFRKIARSIYEASRDVARKLVDTPAYQQSRKDRKKVEILFAHMKRILKLDRLRLRGLSGAADEFLLVATVQNLRRMVKYMAKTRQCQQHWLLCEESQSTMKKTNS